MRQNAFYRLERVLDDVLQGATVAEEQRLRKASREATEHMHGPEVIAFCDFLEGLLAVRRREGFGSKGE